MIEKNNWVYYQVGEDEFTYSIEMPGMQMTFNTKMPFEKAKKIAEEVIMNIKGMGQDAELTILDNSKMYKF